MPVTLAKTVNNSTLVVILDPLGYHEKEEGINPYVLMDELGLIPTFIFNTELIPLPMWEALDRQYQHGGGLVEMEATITPEGIFQYPGDPDLFPLAKYKRKDEIAYQYKSGLMAVEHNSRLIPVRMD